MRDITLGETIYMPFSTRAFATGVPTTLAGTPAISAYVDAGLTQITTGITLGVDHDAVTGLNMITVVATSGNGFANATDVSLVITAGTVDSVSVVGEIVEKFTIGRSAAATDLANATDGLGAIKAVADSRMAEASINTTSGAVDTVTTLSGHTPQTADNDTKLTTLLARIVGTLATGTHYPATAAQIAVLSDWINGGRLDLILDIIAADTTTDIPALIATAQTDLDTITDIDGVILGAAGVDLILDEAISDTVHSTSGTLGNRIYLGQTNSWIASSINDAGATTTAFITNLTSTVTDFYKDQSVFFVTGALSGQSRIISGYNGTTKAITVDEAFTSAPVDTTQFGLGSLHVHPITQIQSGLATEAKQDAQDLIITEARLAELDAANLPADIAAIKADTAAILIDTNELQTDWANGGRLDVIIDAILDDTGTSGVILTAAERNSIADAMLDRDMSTGADSGSTTVRTVRQALRANRNKVSISGGVMTITKEDDATSSWTAAITTTAGDPISEIDPA